MGLSQEIVAYDTHLRSQLETDHFGEWAVVHDKKLVGTYPSVEAAANEAVKKFGRGPYLIRRIGSPPITLPASVLYKFSHDEN